MHYTSTFKSINRNRVKPKTKLGFSRKERYNVNAHSKFGFDLASVANRGNREGYVSHLAIWCSVFPGIYAGIRVGYGLDLTHSNPHLGYNGLHWVTGCMVNFIR